MQNKQNVATDGYMTKKDVRYFIGGSSNPIGATTLHDWIADRGFPRPFYISSQCPLWRKAEVVAWLESHSNILTAQETRRIRK